VDMGDAHPESGTRVQICSGVCVWRAARKPIGWGRVRDGGRSRSWGSDVRGRGKTGMGWGKSYVACGHGKDFRFSLSEIGRVAGF
jgi:hypothetical protein